MNILIVKLSAIGDVIHALPVSRAIKETFPEAKVTWAVEPPAYDILAGNPCVDEILIFEKKKFKTFGGFSENFLPMRKKLREGRYDIALDLQGLAKSAALAYFSGAPKRFGTADMREMSSLVSKPVAGPNAKGHIVERYLDVARAIGCRVHEVEFPMEIPERDEESAKEELSQSGVPEGATYAVLAVGANWPNKRWPASYYSLLSDWLFGQKIIPVLVGGGPVDENIAAYIETEAKIPPVSIIGKTSLKELAAVIRGARLVIGGDTGPVHLAAGLRRPTVMLMGPTDANRNGPYGQIENAVEIKRRCRWCWKRACPKGLDCLRSISTETVKEKIRDVLKKTAT